MSKSVNNKIIVATRWSVYAELTAKLAAPIVNIFLARLLTPLEFGVIASITIITSFAEIFTDSGFQKYVIQHEFEDEKELDRYSNVAFTSNAILSLIIFIFILLNSSALSKAIGSPNLSSGLSVASLTVLFTSFSSITVARFRRNLDFKPLFYIRLVSSWIPLLVTVPLAYFLQNYWALVIGTVTQQFLIAILSVIFSYYKPKLVIDVKALSKMLSFSLWSLFETLSIWFSGQVSILIVVSVLDTYYLGLYKTGMSTINSYLSIITASITPILFSVLSRKQDNSVAYKESFNNFQKLIATLIIPMGVGILAYREVVVQILLGPQWNVISDFIGLWAIMSAITITFSNIASEVYRSMGKPKISFLLQLIYLSVYIPVIFFTARISFGMLCFWGSVIRLFPVVLDIFILKYMFKIDLFSLVENTYVQFGGAIIMGISGFYLQRMSDLISWKLFTVFLCAIIYILVISLSPRMRKELQYFRKLSKI